VEALLFRRTAAAYSGNGCPGRFGWLAAWRGPYPAFRCAFLAIGRLWGAWAMADAYHQDPDQLWSQL